jgi:hypothetical protein
MADGERGCDAVPRIAAGGAAVNPPDGARRQAPPTLPPVPGVRYKPR